MDEVGARAGRDRAGAVRGVRAVGLHHRHLRPVLPPVRADHRRRDGDLADRVADAVAGAVRAAAQAARSDAARPSWWERPIHGFFRLFNCGFDGLAQRLRLARRARWCASPSIMLVVYAGVHRVRPQRIPQDAASASSRSSTAAILIVVVATAAGRVAGAHRRRCMRRAVDIALTTPGVAHAVNIVGFSGATFTNAPNAGAIFLVLDPFEKRAKDPDAVGGRHPARAVRQARRDPGGARCSWCCRRRCPASATPAASA